MINKHNKFLTALFATVMMAGTAVNMAQASESKEMLAGLRMSLKLAQKYGAE